MDVRILLVKMDDSMNTSLVLIEGGIHDEGGNSVDINLPISIAGESRDYCIVIGAELFITEILIINNDGWYT